MDIQEKNDKYQKLIDTYGKEVALWYIEGNHQVDILADKTYDQEKQKVPNVNKYHNKYILKTRKKNTKNGKTDTIINTNIRSTLKDTIRNKFSSEL